MNWNNVVLFYLKYIVGVLYIFKDFGIYLKNKRKLNWKLKYYG